MGIDRRNFLKVLGIAGVTLSAGKSFGTTKEKKSDVEFDGILYDSTLCVGCMSCEYACAEQYGLPDPTGEPAPGVVRKTNDTNRIVVNCYNTSKGEQFIRGACNHCNDPACASACLTKAMLKTDEGPVIWREDKCMGCRSCMISCPFDMPKFEYNSPNPKIQKCRMCYELIQEGGMPACVEICGEGALTFGKRRDLIEIARTRIYEEPEKYNHHIYGEHEVGGTGVLYLASVPFKELGFRNDLGTTSYPNFNKTFLYSVPAVLILWPAFLLGLNNSVDERKNKISKEKMN
ncbi:MAG: 4Fe-4S dicluster domain-containing protein [Bacteroidetes bacterium]|nr:4Fe-4S dicluster domain-containing protein [Bacteroidota bacterium]MBL6944195.1 4Fe-4S dicluster domain-containing protein [Bacteroidales bacterium]